MGNNTLIAIKYLSKSVVKISTTTAITVVVVEWFKLEPATKSSIVTDVTKLIKVTRIAKALQSTKIGRGFLKTINK